MNSIVGDRYIAELVQIFEQQGIYWISVQMMYVHCVSLECAVLPNISTLAGRYVHHQLCSQCLSLEGGLTYSTLLYYCISIVMRRICACALL